MVPSEKIGVVWRLQKEVHHLLVCHIIVIHGAVFIPYLPRKFCHSVILLHTYLLGQQLLSPATVVTAVRKCEVKEVTAAQLGTTAKIVQALIVPLLGPEGVCHRKEYGEIGVRTLHLHLA
jgi:hypothetical protein